MSPLIREMSLGDLSSAHEVMQASFPIPWSRNLLEQELSHSWSRSLVAVSADNKLIGVGVFWLIADQFEVLKIATLPQFRRHGVAKALLESALHWAQSKGASQASLEVRASNLGAQALYVSLGFREISRREKYYSNDGEDAVLMLRKLPLTSSF